MKEHAWWLIIWLIINIILTPILMVATAAAGIIVLWGTWLLIIISICTEESRIEKRSQKRTEEFWKRQEAGRPAKEAEIKKRIENNLFTYESFKKYMNERGFDVYGDIDIFCSMIQRVKIETHLSKKQLKDKGIYCVRKILGDYNWWFDFYDFYNGGFSYDKKEIIDVNCGTELVDDTDNVIVYAWYIPERDAKTKIYDNDYIYRIERRREYVPCTRVENGCICGDKEKIKYLSEGDSKRMFHDAAYVYKYKIYKWKSGIEEKINNASLSESEKQFIATAINEHNTKKNKANSYVGRHDVKTYKGYPKALEGCSCYNGGYSNDVYFLLNNKPFIVT